MQEKQAAEDRKADEQARTSYSAVARLPLGNWEFENNEAEWVPIYPDKQSQVEGAFQTWVEGGVIRTPGARSWVILYAANSHSYEIDLHTMLQTNTAYQTQRRVRRSIAIKQTMVGVGELPETWDGAGASADAAAGGAGPAGAGGGGGNGGNGDGDGDDVGDDDGGDHGTCKIVTLDSTGDEYLQVLSSFLATKGSSNFSVVRIQRIQNESEWQRYSLLKQQWMRAGMHNEHDQVWHGTSESTKDKICHGGFNRSFNKAAVYGRGVYFARDAKYSLSDVYSPPSANGLKHLFLCRILLGRSIVGEPGYRDATDAGDSGAKSMVDDLGNPSIFVACHDAQAYPDYIFVLRRLDYGSS
jgi:poly [ADP-ribose] polymerase 10/14/15